MGEAASSSLIVPGRNVIATEVIERAVAERPVHDTIEAIMEWLIGGARQVGSFARTIDELSWRLVAAQEALTALGVLPAGAFLAGEPPLEIVIALHYGSVIYGNVGAADRLDFTVIGPAVNLVSRIEAIAKSRDLPLIMSDDFAGAYGGSLTSLGLHRLRGLDLPHELFTPLER